MLAQHIALDAAERGNDGAHLVNHLQTVAPIRNHLLQAAYLAFNAAKAW
jgi:hypothetical protein